MLRSWSLMAILGAGVLSASCQSGEDSTSSSLPNHPLGTQDTLRDDEILAIVATVNKGEVDEANAALPHLTASDVRDFAQRMVTEHSQALIDGANLAAALDLPPRENDVSNELAAESQAVVSTLAAGNASAEYDLMYIQGQVDGHSSVESLITTTLIPSADDPLLLGMLKSMRKQVQGHLTTAQSIVEVL